MTDKAGYPQAAFGGDTIRTVTLTPQEQAAYASGWNLAIEAAAKDSEATLAYGTKHAIPSCIRALSMPAPAQAWRVKPLEWEDFEGWGAKAKAMLLTSYIISKWSDGRFEVTVSAPGYGTGFDGERFHPTIGAAKAAAQADYAARILAALIPDTEGGA